MVVYKQYLRSPEWRRRRVAVIVRAKGRCERCRLWPIVNLHHLSYANLGNEPLTDLLGVCSKCHKELHP
jgi:hypothetical protein